MKRILLIISSLALVFGLASCNKEKDVMPDGNENGFTYVFSIGNTDANGTRASLASEDGQSLIAWDDNDKIGTQAGTQKGYSHVAVSNDGVATFSIYSRTALQVGDYIYCYYPHTSNQDIDNISMSIPASQQMKDTGFDVTAMPMISIPYEVKTTLPYSSNNSTVDVINFAYLGSLIDFRIYTTNSAYQTEKIEWIQFESTAISGSFTFTGARSVDYANKSSLSIPAVTGTTVKTAFATPVTVGNSKENAIHAYMVVAPGKHSGTVTIKTDKASYVYTVSEKDYNRAALKPLAVDLQKASSRDMFATSFEKYTSSTFEAGKYIIVNSGVGYVATGELTSGNKLAAVAITPDSDGTITCSSDYIIQIEKESEGVYSLKNSSGEYITYSSSTDFSMSNSATSNKAKWTISINSSSKQATIQNVGDTGRNIRFYNSDFRAYPTSNGTGIFLYSIIEYKTIESISVTGGTREFYLNDAFNYDGLVVTAHFDDGSSSVVTPSSVSTPDMSTTGEKTVTVSYTYKGVTKEATYTIEVLARPSFSVTLGDTQDVLTEDNPGAGVTLPSRDDSGNYTFCGWSETELTEATTTAPAIIAAGLYHPSSNETLYPVYSTTSEVPGPITYNITTTLTAGKTYLFGAVRAAASPTLAYNKTVGIINVSSTTADSWGSFVAVTPSSDGVIASSSVTNACKWTLESINQNAIVLKNQSNNYFWVKSSTGANTVAVTTSSNTVYIEDVHTTCKDAFMIHPTSTSTNRLMLNNANGYRMYGATSAPSATFSPYVWFFEETSTTVSTTAYISVIN